MYRQSSQQLSFADWMIVLYIWLEQIESSLYSNKFISTSIQLFIHDSVTSTSTEEPFLESFLGNECFHVTRKKIEGLTVILWYHIHIFTYIALYICGRFRSFTALHYHLSLVSTVWDQKNYLFSNIAFPFILFTVLSF